MSDKTYGRKIVRGNKDEVVKRLYISWGMCFLIGFTIGCILIACLSKCEQTPKETVHLEEDDLIRWKQETEEVTIEELEIEPVQQAPSLINLGEFRLSAYCPCSECSSGWGTQTSTGAVATEGRTVAVDPSVIQYGTMLIINGHEYVAEDCGGAIKGNRIDIFFESHEAADEFGVQYAEVFLKKGGL